MGILRLVLAFLVVIEHTKGNFFGLKLMAGSSAVQTFYIISGFTWQRF